MNDIIAITKTDNLMDEIQKLAQCRFLVGDAAYELTEHLLTPFTGSQRLDQGKDNRKISMIFPLVSCCSCDNSPSSS